MIEYWYSWLIYVPDFYLGYFTWKLGLSSIFKNIKVIIWQTNKAVFHFQIYCGSLPLSKNWGCLPICWLSFIFNLHSWVEIRLHTNDQTPSLPGDAQMQWSTVWFGVFFTNYKTNLGDFVLGWPRLWQIIPNIMVELPSN